ncbi:MAG: hypothetical protein ABS81_16780 [Pseudonocardia sp. SCN 72-86]|nr:MAG: hypothetical protein ABS81_16780 [Pseudonocardia sp. SCN 72-86]
MSPLDTALSADVAAAVDAVRVAAVAESGRQADRLLDGAGEPGERDHEIAWQVLQFRIHLAIGLDPLPDLVGLRRIGITWEVIARAAGVTRQSAHERWARPVADVLDRYGTGELPGGLLSTP